MWPGLDVLDRRLDPGAHTPLAVAFSGGGDSLALLMLARAWAARAGRPVLALTVDHGLQPESVGWVARAKATAEALGVGFEALRWAEPKPAHGLPAAARSARHRLIAEAARRAGARVVLVGHTFDDLQESAVMRASGSSVGQARVWSPSPAWPEGRDLFYLRPLLGVRRADLRTLLAGQGLDWIEDPANGDLRYARARARSQLAGQAAMDDSDPDEDVGAAVLARDCQAPAWGGLVIARSRLTGAAQGAGRRFLQAAVVCVAGGQGLSRPGRVDPLLERLTQGPPVSATLGGARIIADENILIVRDAGEISRGGLTAVALATDPSVVWDGRYEFSGGANGASVAPLRGQAARLDKDQRRALKDVPAAARPSLPLIRLSDASVTCPVLADRAGVGLRPLVQGRLLAACGAIERETAA